MRERVDRRTDAYMHSRPNDVAAGNSQDAYNTRSGYAIGPATGALSDGCRVPATQPMDCYEEGIHLHYIIPAKKKYTVLQASGRPYKVVQWYAKAGKSHSLHPLPRLPKPYAKSRYSSLSIQRASASCPVRTLNILQTRRALFRTRAHAPLSLPSGPSCKSANHERLRQPIR